MLNQKTRKKKLSFHNHLVELPTKLVNFLCRCAASTYPICFNGSLRLSNLLISLSLPYAILKSLSHTVDNEKLPFLGLLNEFEFVTPRMVEFYTIFLIL